MENIIKTVLDLLAKWFGGLRDRERNVEVQEQILEAEKRIDEKIANRTDSDRDNILERLYRGTNSNNPDSN